MINLRYHIVSLTAVFLAIGIGLTLGSTFLDRATVDNLQGQLESLEHRLDERDTQIQELNEELTEFERTQGALDEQGPGLLAGRLDSVPVVVLSSAGVDEADVDGTLKALASAGADVRGRWQLTDRFLLATDGAVADLAAVLDEDTDDPSRLRRSAIGILGRQLRARQQAELPTEDGDEDELPEGSDPDEQPTTAAAPTTTAPTTTTGTGPDDVGPGQPGDRTPPSAEPDDDLTGPLPIAQDLADAGFLVFDGLPVDTDAPDFPAGTRLVIVGGSPDVPDDVVLEPLIERLALGSTGPIPVVVGSAMDTEGGISDIVAVIRQDERLRMLLSTVDNLEHFHDWTALVLAVADLDEAVVGHYGLHEGATRLLPPLQDP